VIDGKILTESIGTALAAGRFAHVPILNGNNQIEELIFVAGLHVAVSGGQFVGIPDEPIGPDNYQSDIAAVLGVSSDRAAAIAARYPIGAYPNGDVAMSVLASDANFACPAEQIDRWTSAQVPTFAYEFDDSNAPERFAGPPLPPAATHSSEIQYIFDQPNAPYPGTFTANQQALATRMRAAWASFAASGDPSTPALSWPSFDQGEHVMSLVPPQPQDWTGSRTRITARSGLAASTPACRSRDEHKEGADEPAPPKPHPIAAPWCEGASHQTTLRAAQHFDNEAACVA
jgi:para-nitrobenzyl esterase